MSSLKEEMVLAGIVTPEMATEIACWGTPLDELLDLDWDNKPTTTEEALLRIRKAIEDRDQVEIRSTDLNIMRRYLENQEEGKLHLEDPITKEKSNIKVTFAFSEDKKVIIPWRSETITDLLTHPESYLRIGDRKMWIGVGEELYFGKQKTFLLCTISEVEDRNV